ncbi:hypothetical protein VN0347_03930 [Helicobacter pylori]|uniref:hypothetical protein n=1 Tax=Helicobacter pylori TaxID=210 RepID=UPI001AAC2BC8|nr:hypothetical protein [Helicobacter pylori]GHP70387.1 hypothetical protein VN1196_14970 [Helicobacter pylori]GHR07103.1 hypothetical protein VN1246_06350 [Helicobacter pylori]
MKIKAIMLGLVAMGALAFASDYEGNVFGYTTEGEPIYKKTIIEAIINTDERIKEVMNAMVMMTNEIKKNHEMSTLNSVMIKESGDTVLALVKKVKKLEKEVKPTIPYQQGLVLA